MHRSIAVRTLAVLLVLGGCASSTPAYVPATSSTGPMWDLTAHQVALPGLPMPGDRIHLSCAAKNFCAAVDESISAVAPILLMIGAGGGLGGVMIAAGVGGVIADYVDNLGISVLLAAWVIAAAMRLSIGSATVAIVTAAGIVAPIAAHNPSVSPELLVLALGSGSVIFPHVNNGGSWMVKETFGMSLADMFKSYSTWETVIAVLGLAATLGLATVV